ncbi:hypothetical protein [Streptomyces nojiriensis]|nr:hypothetical protein [Streptomyces nojiriensis]
MLVRVANPRRVAKKAAAHYRGAASVPLAGYIPFGGVHGQTLWALVVVIAILTAGDIAVTRRTAGTVRDE